MESRLRRIINTIPGAPAEPQHKVHAGDDNYVLDFAYQHVLLGIEAHSLRWHLGRERWIKDLRRDRGLKGIGWTLLYYSWDDIHLDPQGVAGEILSIRSNLERALFSRT
jgi:very-short-patch-repair endonuclease